MKYEILFVAGMQWWGRLEELLSKKVFHLTFETDPDDAHLRILSGQHFDLVICADTVAQGDRHDGLHLANQLRRAGHKVLVISDFEVKGLPAVTSHEFHNDNVGLMRKIYKLIAEQVREAAVPTE